METRSDDSARYRFLWWPNKVTLLLKRRQRERIDELGVAPARGSASRAVADPTTPAQPALRLRTAWPCVSMTRIFSVLSSLPESEEALISDDYLHIVERLEQVQRLSNTWFPMPKEFDQDISTL